MIKALLLILAMATGLYAEFIPASITYDYLRIFSYSFLSAAVFLWVPYNSIFSKTAAFTLFIFSWINLFAQIVTGYHEWDKSHLFFITLFLMAASFFFCIFKNYYVPSDEYSDSGVFIAFKKPKRLVDLVDSFLGRPVSSVSVIVDGGEYRYKKKKQYKYVDYVRNPRHIYIKTNINPILVHDTLSKCIGHKWSFKNNCCSKVMQLYPQLENTELNPISKVIISLCPTLKPYFNLNLLPCFLINSILKEEK